MFSVLNHCPQEILAMQLFVHAVHFVNKENMGIQLRVLGQGIGGTQFSKDHTTFR